MDNLHDVFIVKYIMARTKKFFKPMRSKKSARKTNKRISENNQILKKYLG